MNQPCLDVDALVDIARGASASEDAAAHLATCPDCQRELRFLQQLRGTLAAVSVSSNASIDEVVERLPSPDAPISEPPLWRSLAASLPAAALAFVTVLFACVVGGVFPGAPGVGLALAAAAVAFVVDQRISYWE